MGGRSLKIAAQAYDFSDQDVEEITSEVRAVLAGRRYLTVGEHVARFESAFASYHRAPFAVATSSGTPSTVRRYDWRLLARRYLDLYAESAERFARTRRSRPTRNDEKRREPQQPTGIKAR